MTLPNQISCFRILLIPVFVWCGITYGDSVHTGLPDPRWHVAAVVVFVVAALSDALDGWIARRFKLCSRLGAILDPIADKGLLLAALMVLSLAGWPERLPLWFTILVISRDLAILSASLLLRYLSVEFEVRPSLLGKLTTVAQMTAIVWVMLQLDWIDPRWPVFVAGLLTLASWLGYFLRFRQLLKEQTHVR